MASGDDIQGGSVNRDDLPLRLEVRKRPDAELDTAGLFNLDVLVEGERVERIKSMSIEWTARDEPRLRLVCVQPDDLVWVCDRDGVVEPTIAQEGWPPRCPDCDASLHREPKEIVQEFRLCDVELGGVCLWPADVRSVPGRTPEATLDVIRRRLGIRAEAKA
jgi:hypothetical protein